MSNDQPSPAVNLSHFIAFRGISSGSFYYLCDFYCKKEEQGTRYYDVVIELRNQWKQVYRFEYQMQTGQWKCTARGISSELIQRVAEVIVVLENRK